MLFAMFLEKKPKSNTSIVPFALSEFSMAVTFISIQAVGKAIWQLASCDVAFPFKYLELSVCVCKNTGSFSSSSAD